MFKQMGIQVIWQY